MNWQEAISHCHNEAAPFAVATVIGTTGSTPRAGSAKMVITGTRTFDTVGGGQLEYRVIEAARDMLSSQVPAQKIEHLPLATRADQCCGGSVTVLLESFPVTAMRLAVFGAGHVASALMLVLGQCDARIDWIDSRHDLFPKDLPANVKALQLDDPVSFVDELSDVHRCIIVTHDHALDYRLTHAILTRTEIDYIGLIGSDTKARRFMKRLEKDGVGPADRRRCHCPIGLASVRGKLPMEIAVSIVAEVLSLDPSPASEVKPDLTWKQIREAFVPKT